VGRVSAKKLIQSESGNEVVVELDLDGDVVLGKGATALLQSDFLGTISIDINDGDLSNPIAFGDTIKGTLQKGLQTLFEESAQPIANNLEVTISKINGILTNFEGTSTTIKETLGSFKKAADNIDLLVTQNNTKLSKTLEEFQVLAAELSSRAQDVQPVLKKYGELADSLKAIEFNKTLAKLNSAIDDLSTVLIDMNSSNGTLGKLIHSDSLYNTLNKTLEDLDMVILHLEEEPDRKSTRLNSSHEWIGRMTPSA